MSQLHSNTWPRARLVFFVFAAMGALLLIAEHRVHVLPYLPWLFVLACPLMHLFHHGGHGQHQHVSEPKPNAGEKS